MTSACSCASITGSTHCEYTARTAAWMKPSPLVQKLLALFVAGALLFNFPLLRLWLGSGLWYGLPRLPVALFLAWVGLIALLAWWLDRADSDPD